MVATALAPDTHGGTAQPPGRPRQHLQCPRMSLHALVCHPDTPSTAIERVEVAIQRDGGALRLCYRMLGDAERVAAAPSQPGALPRRRDELWRTTCCELFVRDADGPGYREYNFAPCGDWAAYRFSGYRTGMTPLDTDPPWIVLERAPDVLALTATLAAFDETRVDAGRIGLACVIASGAEVSFWALAHPPGRPDFHHPVAFGLRAAPGLDA